MISMSDFEKKYGTNMNSFAHWEDVETALQSDEWKPVFSEFVFNKNDIEKHFTFLKLSNNFYPKKETFLDILDKCGIELCPISNNIYEIIDYIQLKININPLLCKGIEEDETIRQLHISTRVTKCGRRMGPDGRFINSGPQSAEHPFWDRAVAIWNKEEEFTEGYTKNTYTQNGQTKKIFYNYNNRWKRQSCLDTYKAHALGVARTKSINAVCSVLAGLPTGFNMELLSKGCLGFVKFVRTPQYQKMYTLARIESIRNGNTGQIQQTSNLLFGPEKIEVPAIDTDIQPDIKKRIEEKKYEEEDLF